MDLNGTYVSEKLVPWEGGNGFLSYVGNQVAETVNVNDFAFYGLFIRDDIGPGETDEIP